MSLQSPLRLFSIVALSVALHACGCGEKPKPDAGIELDAGEVDAGQPQEDAGEPVVDAGEPDAGPPPVLAVKRILPPRGSSAGGTTVTLVGSAFIRDFASGGTSAQRLTSITFGGNPVLDFQVIDDETIELRSPPGTAGQVSVVLKNPNGRVTCNNCFTYFDELALTSLTPKHGPLAGGTVVTLTGQGFTTDVEVLFGGLSSPQVTVASPQSLTAVAPPGAVAGPGRRDRLQQERRGHVAPRLSLRRAAGGDGGDAARRARWPAARWCSSPAPASPAPRR